jgi:tRNA(adenine34) deaminase
MLKTKKLSLMQYAFQEAQKAFDLDEIPVGAVISYKNHIIAAAHNATRAIPDPTGHAEIRAINPVPCVQQLFHLPEYGDSTMEQ